MGLFSKRPATTQEPPKPAPKCLRGNGDDFSNSPPTIVTTGGADDELPIHPPPKDHVIAGTDEDGKPVYLPARAHWDICGASGSGKGAFLGNMLLQLIARYPDEYLCFIDLGGDAFLYHLCREACEKSGRAFRHFTLSSAFTYCFDPIAACTANTTVTERAAIITSGLGLWYGSGYGKSFHGSVNKEEVEKAFERLEKADIPATLNSLAEEMQRGKRVRQRDISEAALRLGSMRRVPQLSVADDPAKQLTFSSGFDTAAFDYFWLPTNRDDVMPVSVATMAFSGVLNEATTRRERGKQHRYAQVFIDEAALLNGARSMESKLPLARKWLSIKLAYQYRSQWCEHGKYMPDSIATNCPVRVLFSASCEDDFRDLQLQSDEEPKQLGSITSSGLSVRKTIRDDIRPSLERNKIRDITKGEGRAFYAGSARKGDPLPFTIAYATSIEQHERLSHMPVMVLEDTIAASNAPEPKPEPLRLGGEGDKRRLAVLKKLLTKKRDLESFEAA